MLRDGDFDKRLEFKRLMESVGGRQFYDDNLNSAYERYKADYKKVFKEDAPTVSVVRV